MIDHLCSFPPPFQAKKRTNVIPMIEDARHPHKYRMLVGMVDVIFADVAQPNQGLRIVLCDGVPTKLSCFLCRYQLLRNTHNFQSNGGHFVISIKASCIDSTAEPAAVFAAEVNKMKTEKMKPREQLTSSSLSATALLLPANGVSF